jgi:hypothetical protein
MQKTTVIQRNNFGTLLKYFTSTATQSPSFLLCFSSRQVASLKWTFERPKVKSYRQFMDLLGQWAEAGPGFRVIAEAEFGNTIEIFPCQVCHGFSQRLDKVDFQNGILMM